MFSVVFKCALSTTTKRFCCLFAFWMSKPKNQFSSTSNLELVWFVLFTFRNGQFQDWYHGYLPRHDPEISDGKIETLLLAYSVVRKLNFQYFTHWEGPIFNFMSQSNWLPKSQCGKLNVFEIHKSVTWCQGLTLLENISKSRHWELF